MGSDMCIIDRIPTINVYYFNHGNLSFTYRRQYSLYVGYRYNF
ncbi:hypothetical protein HpBGD84_16970 [Helicobacter pylori]